MNKKLIRLTEGDLHRIVKESVQKILIEADPRSWDAVARRYDETDPQKAAYARQRAAQQWNNQYGYNVGYSSKDPVGRRIDTNQSQSMDLTDGGKYIINQKNAETRTPKYIDSDSRFHSYQTTNRYDPSTQMGHVTRGKSHTLGYDPSSADWEETHDTNAFMHPNWQVDYEMRNRNKTYGNNPDVHYHGQNVANQMAQGNGIYDKSKGGWQ